MLPVSTISSELQLDCLLGADMELFPEILPGLLTFFSLQREYPALNLQVRVTRFGFVLSASRFGVTGAWSCSQPLLRAAEFTAETVSCKVDALNKQWQKAGV